MMLQTEVGHVLFLNDQSKHLATPIWNNKKYSYNLILMIV